MNVNFFIYIHLFYYNTGSLVRQYDARTASFPKGLIFPPSVLRRFFLLYNNSSASLFASTVNTALNDTVSPSYNYLHIYSLDICSSLMNFSMLP